MGVRNIYIKQETAEFLAWVANNNYNLTREFLDDTRTTATLNLVHGLAGDVQDICDALYTGEKICLRSPKQK